MSNKSTTNQFRSLFLDRLRELYSGEEQILDALPSILEVVSSQDLKLTLEETFNKSRQRLEELKKEFSNLHETPKGLFSESISSMLQQCQYLKTKNLPNIVKEAALIPSIQKILHYQIAGYGGVKAFAKHLNLNDIYIVIKGFLDDIYSLDSKLTEVAEGDYYTKGINEAAAE